MVAALAAAGTFGLPQPLGEKYPQIQIQKDQNQAQHPGQKYVQDPAQDVKKVSEVKKTSNDTEEINTAETKSKETATEEDTEKEKTLIEEMSSRT